MRLQQHHLNLLTNTAPTNHVNSMAKFWSGVTCKCAEHRHTFRSKGNYYYYCYYCYSYLSYYSDSDYYYYSDCFYGNFCEKFYYQHDTKQRIHISSELWWLRIIGCAHTRTPHQKYINIYISIYESLQQQQKTTKKERRMKYLYQRYVSHATIWKHCNMSEDNERNSNRIGIVDSI